MFLMLLLKIVGPMTGVKEVISELQPILVMIMMEKVFVESTWNHILHKLKPTTLKLKYYCIQFTYYHYSCVLFDKINVLLCITYFI